MVVQLWKMAAASPSQDAQLQWGTPGTIDGMVEISEGATAFTDISMATMGYVVVVQLRNDTVLQL